MGKKYLILILLLLAFMQVNAQRPQLIINEVSQGTSGTKEYIELVVTGPGSCSDSVADIRGFYVDDHNGWYGDAAMQGIASGSMRFPNIPTWSKVPYGSIILLYNGDDKNNAITLPDDPTDANADKVYIISIVSGTPYIELNKSSPSTPSYQTYPYVNSGYTTTAGINYDWGVVGLSNNGDAAITIDPMAPSVPCNAVTFGNVGVGVNGAPLPPVHLAAAGSTVYYVTGSNWLTSAGWASASTSGSAETPGAPNTTANATWINGLRTAFSSGLKLSLSTTNANCGLNGSATVTVTGGATPYTYLWGTTPVQTTPTATGLLAGKYSITVTDNGGCVKADTATIIATPAISISISTTPTTCTSSEGTATVTVNSGTSPYTYSWNTAPPQSTAKIINLSKGKYIVTVTDAAGCKKSDTATISLTADEKVFVSADTTICQGNTATLIASNMLTYQWAPSATLSCTACSTTYATPKTTTSYTVYAVNAKGCKDTAAVKVSVIGHTNASVGADVILCDGDQAQLMASGGISYKWSPSEPLNNDTLPDPVAKINTTTKFTVIIKENQCFQDTLYQSVIINKNPVIDLGPDLSVLPGTEVQLMAKTSKIKKIEWLPAQGLSCSTCIDPKVTVNRNVTYVANVTTDDGCVGTGTINIRVSCEGVISYMPNAFTPNGDGENDYFYPQGKGLGTIRSFRVMNSWGQVVFSSSFFPGNVAEQGWNGTFQGKPVPPDVFLYSLELGCPGGEISIIKGDVTLLR